MKCKTVILIVVGLFLLFPVIAFCGDNWEFYIFGVNVDRFKDMNWLTAAGVVSSVVVHEVAHMLYLDLNGIDFWLERDGFRLAVCRDQPLSHHKARVCARAGFVSQLIIGSFLPGDSDFTVGWVGIVNYQLFSYGFDRPGDFRNIELHGGDSDKEYQAFSLWVTLLGDRMAGAY